MSDLYTHRHMLQGFMGRSPCNFVLIYVIEPLQFSTLKYHMQEAMAIASYIANFVLLFAVSSILCTIVT